MQILQNVDRPTWNICRNIITDGQYVPVRNNNNQTKNTLRINYVLGVAE